MTRAMIEDIIRRLRSALPIEAKMLWTAGAGDALIFEVGKRKKPDTRKKK